MSWISKILSAIRPESTGPVVSTPELTAMMCFIQELDNLLKDDAFIARKEYMPLVVAYAPTYDFFDSIRRSKTMGYYCEQNSASKQYVERFLSSYSDLANTDGSKAIEAHNKDFIKRHLKEDESYLDNVLKKVDPVINLDEEQRKVVLSDEDYMLVVAGAGAGKTTTVAAKVKYLVEKKHIDPKQILVISYTNKAVGELAEKINKQLGIPCPVTTFHKTGYAILRKQEEERMGVVDGGFMYNVVNNYLKNNILEQPELVDKLILFFGAYFDAPYEGDDLNSFFNYVTKGDFSTLKGSMEEFNEKVIDRRTGHCFTIAHEVMRSQEEVRIANYLYLNKIEYEYEKIYPYFIKNSCKPYTPDFTLTQGDKTLYLEHFGITEDGRNNRYDAATLAQYKKSVNDKILFHRAHNTNLIYTFSQYKDGRDTLEHLEEQLQKAGFVLEQRPSKEVFEKLVSSEENRYIVRLVNLVCTFLSNFKTNGFTIETFYKMERQAYNVRTKLFLQICQQCFLEYSKRLKERNFIDFEDMINDSARILREQKSIGSKLDFKYIIIDEYQDISRQRFDLSKSLSDICDAKIVSVGDDWQSIYAYAGSDIKLFTKFKETMGYAEMLKITKTYRNSQEIIDIAGKFVQKNESQLKKDLVSPKHIDCPIQIDSYSEIVDRKQFEGKGGRYYLIGKTVEKIIARIIAAGEGKKSLLLLGRYGFDAFNLCRSNDFEYNEKTGGVRSLKYPDVNIEFLTVHRAKGLGYDNVIIINARNEVYGFPSQVQEDPVLKLVVKDDHSIEYAEERRLFYVALTRTKNRVYIITPEQRPSKFVIELLDENPHSVVLNGQLNRQALENVGDVKSCPVCGYPLQMRYRKDSGLKMWLCTNEPEICDFMTNDLKGGELSVLKCDTCKDGYLIVKPGKQYPFLGCTNYKADGTGCNRMMNDIEYRKLFHRPNYGKNKG